MMKEQNAQNYLTEEEIRRVASLARLKITDEDLKLTASKLEQTLEHFANISGLSTDEVEPVYHPLELENSLREDRILPGLTLEQVLSISPAHKDGCLTVPKTVE